MHQILDPLARTSFDDVHWGNLVRNVVREIQLEQLVDADALRSRVEQLGDVGAGAGDPSGLVVDAHGDTVVTLAGTDELLRIDHSHTQQRMALGRRPLALLTRDGGHTYFVANSLDDTISFVDVRAGRVTTVALDQVRSNTESSTDLALRGQRLFFDARLSHDGWMSCHSCHSDGHSPGQLADTLGDDSFGTPKRVLSLLGVGATAPYAWNGAQATLEAQIEKTLRQTMHVDDVGADTVAALAAYLHTLDPPPQLASGGAGESAQRGSELFERSGCTECHVPPLFTSADAYAVGITDEVGADEFNPPSLRGVTRRSRLFHDGRFRELETLLASGDHPGSEMFDQRQIEDVAAYLRSL